MFEFALFVLIVFQGLIVILLLKLGGDMDVLNQAITRLQNSVAAVLAKVDALKAGQLDPAALQTAADSLNALSDSLDAKVA